MQLNMRGVLPHSVVQEYAYTMAAAYRSEQRRLLSFLRMADFMMCDTLQTVLVQSVSEMLAALEPSAYTGSPAEQHQGMPSGSGASSAFSMSSGGRSLQAMSTMLNSSRRARASLAVAGLQLQPVTAAQQAAAAEAAAAAAPAVGLVGAEPGAAAVSRPPLLEMDVVMDSSCDSLSFVPEPEQFQVCLGCSLSSWHAAWPADGTGGVYKQHHTEAAGYALQCCGSPDPALSVWCPADPAGLHTQCFHQLRHGHHAPVPA